MHKLMVMSKAYRQSSARDAKLVGIDPENRLLGRMPVRRLDAESVRDAILTVSGKLSTKQFGPPVPIAFDELGQVVVGVDTTDAAGRPTKKVVSLNGEEYRRSLYVQVRRSRPLGVLETFDGAAVSPNCEIRNSSTVTPQSLLMMNSRFIHEQADFLAKRVQNEGGKDVRAQIALAWRLAFGSEPMARDIDDAVTFISEQTSVFREQPNRAEPELRALASFCQALLSANRFLYVD
jgi:hypothetical protein